MPTQTRPPWAAFALMGFTAIIAQIVCMRELIVVFSGNEISLGLILASWMLWTALGSGVLGRVGSNLQNSRRWMAILQGLLGLLFPITVLAVRASKSFFRPTAGEILGPGPVLVTSLVVLVFFCPVSGWLFAVASRAYAESGGARTEVATSFVYLLEAAGSGLGGLVASLALLRYFDSIEIASILALANLGSAMLLAIRETRRRVLAAGILVAIFTLVIFPIANPFLQRVSLGWLWRGYEIVGTRDSVYGNLAVLQTPGSRSLFENGMVSFSVPDPAASEEAVHFALLQHPAPKRLLLIGGGANGGIAQALQHSSLERVDYVELDPAALDLAREYFPGEWAPHLSDSRIHIRPMDGRLFLKTTPEVFDVIILNLADPQTAQLNRFYTAEFFQEAAEKLAPGGVFSFQVSAAEDYISPELADFLRCLRRTLNEVFADVTFIPGETAHFFAAKEAGILAADPQSLVRRLSARGLKTQYVREYYIPFRMAPDRMADFDAQTRPQAGTPVNHDFAPVAYFFDVVLWGKKFNQSFRTAFSTAAGLSFNSVILSIAVFLAALSSALYWITGSSQRPPLIAGACTAATGFTSIGLELFILLGFQALYGFVYHQLAVLMAAFMAGMALGSWWVLYRNAGVRRAQRRGGELSMLVVVQAVVAIVPLVIYLLFVALGNTGNLVARFVTTQIAFPLLALLCGAIGGYQFAIASRIFFAGRNQSEGGFGVLYALDLAGACLSAIILSVYFIPVFGFLKTAICLTFLNLAPASLALAASREALGHRE